MDLFSFLAGYFFGSIVGFLLTILAVSASSYDEG